MNGFINLNKPKGWTSRDAVNKVRNLLHAKSAGHMGTLDPQGEGVLPIAVGKATRLFDVLLAKDKVYSADFTFGCETDTLDGDGTVTASGFPVPGKEEIESALPDFIGKQLQLPPAYSAKSVNGRRAYEMARSGETVELRPSEVEIRSIELTSSRPPVFTFRICCSADTYIRSICRDLAEKLSTKATMTAITRLRSGNFTIENSVTLDELIRSPESAVIPLGEALCDFPRLDVPDEWFDRLLNGVTPECDFTEFRRVYCRGELFGLGRAQEGRLKIKPYLRDPS